MNAIEYWPVIDTSIKIALGASIAGLTFWLANRTQGRFHTELESPCQRRRILLEEVSEAVGSVNHIFAKYSALVIESTRFGSRWPQARQDELTRINQELVVEFNKLAQAEAKLLMLGEKLMERTLRLYAAKIAYFRKQVYVGRQDITETEIAKLKQEVVKLREQFYDILSRKYDRLLMTE